jgi:Transposase IS66 family
VLMAGEAKALIKRTKAQNLLLRLDCQETEALRFAHDFQVPFTNNLAEQDIRMIKLQQKISGCWRTDHGAQRYVRVRSYISTTRTGPTTAHRTHSARRQPSVDTRTHARLTQFRPGRNDLNSYNRLCIPSQRPARETIASSTMAMTNPTGIGLGPARAIGGEARCAGGGRVTQ